MNKNFLQSLFTCFCFWFFQSLSWGRDSTPNVIVVMTDDQGYGDLGCHGSPILKTPNLDRLYAESVRFTDFHVSPFCTPTRAALMTGNHPGVTGAYRTSAGRTMMHASEKTLGHLFSENGYATGMVGKWHLGDNAPHRPQDRGFEDVVWHRCGGVGQASDYWGNDYFDDTYERVRPGSREGAFEKFEGYCTDVWFREGIRFVTENKDKPFFLYLATNAPHGPFRVDPEWAEPYLKEGVNNPNFFGMIANFDHNLGLLRQRLKELGISNNTIFLFLTDNGTAAGCQFEDLDSEPILGFNAGMRGKKSSVFDGGHRVPLFVHWREGGLLGGRDIQNLTAHIDLLPTLAELCGLPAPNETYEVDGKSLVPLLGGDNQKWERSHHFIQYHGGRGNTDPLKPMVNSVVLTEKWRLLRNPNAPELYDIEADPAQRKNLASRFPRIVEELENAYEPFWQRVSKGLRPVPITVGDPTENPAVLCSQDWRPDVGNPPWNFNSIKKIPKVTHPWLIEVKRSGEFRITLRQWPKEAEKPIVASRAVLKVAGRQRECAIKPGISGVAFEITLPVGITELWTYLLTEAGEVGGAYFTEVEAL